MGIGHRKQYGSMMIPIRNRVYLKCKLSQKNYELYVKSCKIYWPRAFFRLYHKIKRARRNFLWISNRWKKTYHIHHKGGQILLVTGGRGWYQEEGKPARELKAGDVVNISPEVKHWHGAAKDSWFQHLAVEVPAEGASNEWLEFLPEEEYNKLP